MAKQKSKSDLSNLPFVCFRKRCSNKKHARLWCVPPTDNSVVSYALACETGRKYASDLIRFLKTNPGVVGSNTLGVIAACIDFKDKTTASGYWVGFFSYLERFIHAGAIGVDGDDDLACVDAHYAEIIDRRDAEERALAQRGRGARTTRRAA